MGVAAETEVNCGESAYPNPLENLGILVVGDDDADDPRDSQASMTACSVVPSCEATTSMVIVLSVVPRRKDNRR
jgi:hypothetical protein